MRKLMHVALVVLAAWFIQSCSSTRSSDTGSASGPTMPGSGSAADLAAGRNTTGTPIPDNKQAISATAAEGAISGAADSLSNKVDAAASKGKPAKFITEAALNGGAAVRLSTLALSKSQNAYVKAFAAMMIKDHGGANAALKSLAASKNITTDSTAADIDQEMTQLTTASTQDFDSLYIQLMTKDHEQAVNLFEEGTKSSDPEVKAYAQKYLPMLKMHLKNISSLNSQ
jgi:putative membrane protein